MKTFSSFLIQAFKYGIGYGKSLKVHLMCNSYQVGARHPDTRTMGLPSRGLPIMENLTDARMIANPEFHAAIGHFLRECTQILQGLIHWHVP